LISAAFMSREAVITSWRMRRSIFTSSSSSIADPFRQACPLPRCVLRPGYCEPFDRLRSREAGRLALPS
jgi:hypothetical protein